MKKLFFGILFIFLLIGDVGRAQSLVLDSSTIGKMKPETKILYDKSQKELDKVNYSGGIETLISAYKDQPELIQLGFLIGNLSFTEAKKHADEEYGSFLLKSKNAYEQVLKTTDLKVADEQKAKSLLLVVQASLDTQKVREEKSQKAAQETVQREAEEIQKLDALRETERIAAITAANNQILYPPYYYIPTYPVYPTYVVPYITPHYNFIPNDSFDFRNRHDFGNRDNRSGGGGRNDRGGGRDNRDRR